MKKLFEIPKFNEAQISKQAEKQIKFLKAVYPFLEDEENWNEGAIELRPLQRSKDAKYLKSYNAWHIQEKDIDALKKFLGMVNGKGYCLYFSGFAFDYQKEVLKPDGKKYQKGKINNENSLFTCILSADFDGISAEEFKESKQRLLDIGIETIDVFTGHGFQSHILLNHQVLDKDIFKKFTELLTSKGFKVDPAIVDSARILRMPYTFNCKALDKNSKYYDAKIPEILPTTDVGWTEKRYHVLEIFQKLQSLPDVIPQTHTMTEIEIKSIPTAPLVVAEKKKKELEIKEVGRIKLQSLKDVYTMIDYERLPEAIQKMLAGTQHGIRNQVILFLIPFLRNTLGLNIQTIKQVMSKWAELSGKDVQFILSEVDRIYALAFKGKYGKYTAELAQAYGYLEFSEFKRDNKIVIPNSLLKDFDVIADGSVRIYLAMKLEEKISGIKEYTKKDIQRIADISERTIERNMKDLVAMGYICKRRTNRRQKEEYIFHISPYFSSVQGFTMLENAVVKAMLNDLTDGEMKLYSYLCFMVGKESKNCWASQKYLSEKIGKSGHSVISKMTDLLSQKGFITKKTFKRDEIMHSVYNLNY
ncbi:hypothetical protein [Desulfosporosinus metallidurans]|uniref:Uncharacterized protein n=1 Tax=Desulfosporosinus metallidurans TaxID=1888891 RepID=A0A1Q8R2W5_9FIRM|nr:hypothetical protein [Desulfosporosinus metallidurans]OLN33841.1 hypothetical protein DSOL_0019 [Desulfosporosinus metallidurans]